MSLQRHLGVKVCSCSFEKLELRREEGFSPQWRCWGRGCIDQCVRHVWIEGLACAKCYLGPGFCSGSASNLAAVRRFPHKNLKQSQDVSWAEAKCGVRGKGRQEVMSRVRWRGMLDTHRSVRRAGCRHGMERGLRRVVQDEGAARTRGRWQDLVQGVLWLLSTAL